MKVVVRSVVLLTLILFAAHRQARAFDYCPQAYYGFINNTYTYYCDYCDSTGACQTCGVSVANSYTCGGDYMCCSGAPDNCINPIPAGAVLLNGETEDEDKANAKRAPTKEIKPALAAKFNPARVPLMIGEKQQGKFISPTEIFQVPGPHVVKDIDVVVKISEPAGDWSYFRLFRLVYVDPQSKQHTIYMAMEIDPTSPPAGIVLIANRVKKGKGPNVVQHKITYQGEDFDASSVRDLSDKSN